MLILEWRKPGFIKQTTGGIGHIENYHFIGLKKSVITNLFQNEDSGKCLQTKRINIPTTQNTLRKRANLKNNHRKWKVILKKNIKAFEKMLPSKIFQIKLAKI